MDIRNVTVAGGGVLGSQIAMQSAFKGFDVTLWLRSEGSMERAQAKLERLGGVYRQTLEAMKTDPQAYCRGLAESPDLSPEQIDALIARADEASGSISLTTDARRAFGNADLVIEAIAEILDEKAAFYSSIRNILPERTILCTNSSTLLPSALAGSTGRPDRFLALHFANSIWRNNTAEIMGTPATSEETRENVIEFAEEISMIPLVLKKEQPGYLLNSMLVPFLDSAEALLADGVANVETIDAAWTLGTGAPLGPFRILDVVGLNTAYNIVAAKPGTREAGSTEQRVAAMLKQLIDEGKTGVAAGAGFYSYGQAGEKLPTASRAR